MPTTGASPTPPNPTSAVNPSSESIEELARLGPSGPIAMLNVLSYDGDEGRAFYGAYAAVASKTIAAVGGSLLYLGGVVEDDRWDSVAVIHYPSTAAFLEMQRDDRYVAAIPNRTRGLRARLLYPFVLPGDGDAVATKALLDASPGVAGVRLVRSGNDPSGRPNLRDRRDHEVWEAFGDGLVSDGSWAELHVLRTAPGSHGAVVEHLDEQLLLRTEAKVAL